MNLHYIASLPNSGQEGNAKFLRGGDPLLIARWVKAENRPGFGIYYLPNPLKPGATVHGKENIAAIEFIYCDVDFKDVLETADEATQRLANLLLRPTTMVDSGHGRHVLWQLKEAIACDDPEFERACTLQAALIEYLGADPQVRPWSLLRLPGTLNSKQDPHVPCEVATSGPVVDISELREMAELVEGMTLLTRKPKATNGHDYHAEGGPHMAGAERGPVDVEAELAAMAAGKSANATQTRVIPSLLRKAEHPADVLKLVVDETMQRVGKRLGWSRDVEVRAVVSRILSAYNNLLLLGHDFATGTIPAWLPGEFHQRWIAALEDGGRPTFRFNRHGFYLRANGPKGEAGTADAGKGAGEEAKEAEAPADEGAPRKYRFKLVPFSDLKPGPEPLCLVDELIPAAGLVDVWGKAKCYKSFWCLDLMLHVAMGWEYRDRCVRQGAVVYCAFEGAHGYKKRVEALRRHYNIADGTPVPLHIMPGQANLIAEHRVLIHDITGQLGEVRPTAVVLDTLNKSLFGSESKDVDMGAYVRAAEAVRDAFGCVVIIIHHCGYDDTHPRGHTSLPGAVDAQLMVVRVGETVTVTVEMMRDGPEDTAVTSVAVVVEVGHDQNGKVLTSLVLTPGEPAEYAAERRKWPVALAVFYTALKDALASQGAPFQPEVGILPVHAVNLIAVRDRFWRIYTEPEEDEAKREPAIRKAWGRGLREAEKRELVKSLRTDAGKTMVWVPERGAVQ